MTVYAPDVADVPLDSRLASLVAARFAERVLDAARLAPARRSDLNESCELRLDDSVLRLTCTITGSSYERPWDGSDAGALGLADEAAEGTAHLIERTPHYDWMRSGR
jgi:hypothetical protein